WLDTFSTSAIVPKVPLERGGFRPNFLVTVRSRRRSPIHLQPFLDQSAKSPSPPLLIQTVLHPTKNCCK
ncbi:MAG: hypothetical protein VKJ24_16395, partial [Synechococcales bacterium]|nr:hypothetical protein [Synechococcales bacterium]